MNVPVPVPAKNQLFNFVVYTSSEVVVYMLEINELQFGYDKHLLFDGISLHQREGEVLALVGPSGSGKSTLFNLLTGRITGYTGSILINGLCPTKAKSSLTYMTQNNFLLPWRTVMDNMLLIPELQEKWFFKKNNNRSECEWYAKAKTLLEEVGLADVEDYFPDQLSGGMRQRVCFARSLFLARPFLLLDEPFAALDRKTRQEMYLLMHKMKYKYHLTILFITHDMYDLYELADRAYFLDEGHITEIAIGTEMTPESQTLIFGHQGQERMARNRGQRDCRTC